MWRMDSLIRHKCSDDRKNIVGHRWFKGCKNPVFQEIYDAGLKSLLFFGSVIFLLLQFNLPLTNHWCVFFCRMISRFTLRLWRELKPIASSITCPLSYSSKKLARNCMQTSYPITSSLNEEEASPIVMKLSSEKAKSTFYTNFSWVRLIAFFLHIY
jgi:hypothetical protein